MNINVVYSDESPAASFILKLLSVLQSLKLPTKGRSITND